MTKLFDVLVAGEINPDLILAGNVTPEFGQVEKLVDSATLTIGSSSAIFACGAARLGLRVAFVGVCGNDVWGYFMRTALQQRDVDVSHVMSVRGGETGLSVILNREGGSDRAILTHSGLIGALTAEMVTDEVLQQARHLHVAGYFIQTGLRPGLPSLFARAHALGLTTSLDTNYDPTGTWAGLADLWPHTDIFLPNAAEACALTGETEVPLALAALSQRLPIVAVKRGSAGAVLQTGAHIFEAPTLNFEVVDTVGAGDTFDAGFIYGYLHQWPLEQALHLATTCGALSTRGAGGTTTQPTLAEALAFITPSP